MLKLIRRRLTRRPVLGLDFGQHGVKWALVDTTHRVIESLGYISNSAQRTRPLWDDLPRGVRSLRTAVQGQDVAYGYFELPQLERRELATAVQAQAQRAIPFCPQETHFSFCETPPLGQAHNLTGIFFVAARRQRIEKLTFPLQESGFEVSRVELPALALCREYFCNRGQQNEFTFLVHVGHRLTQLVLTRQGYPYFARDFATAGHDFVYALAMGLQCPTETAEQFLESYDFRGRHAAIEPPVLRWLDLVARSAASAEKRLNIQVNKFALSGGGALPGLAQRLEEHLGKSVVTDGWNELRPPRGQELAWRRPELFKLAVGLALEV